jgi:hypothetical protein
MEITYNIGGGGLIKGDGGTAGGNRVPKPRLPFPGGGGGGGGALIILYYYYYDD